MTGTARVVLTLTVFATMLALVVVRPRRWNEAWWTTLGAAAMLVLGLVSPREAIGATMAGKNPLLFLLSLLALSLLVDKSGFFEWAAIRCGVSFRICTAARASWSHARGGLTIISNAER